jgi:hypothetical protein
MTGIYRCDRGHDLIGDTETGVAPPLFMSPYIPSEIWSLVAQFIPDEILWGEFRTVNSAFFRAALDAHHREAYLFELNGELNDSGWLETLERWEKMRYVD